MDIYGGSGRIGNAGCWRFHVQCGKPPLLTLVTYNFGPRDRKQGGEGGGEPNSWEKKKKRKKRKEEKKGRKERKKKKKKISQDPPALFVHIQGRVRPADSRARKPVPSSPPPRPLFYAKSHVQFPTSFPISNQFSSFLSFFRPGRGSVAEGGFFFPGLGLRAVEKPRVFGRE